MDRHARVEVDHFAELPEIVPCVIARGGKSKVAPGDMDIFPSRTTCISKSFGRTLHSARLHGQVGTGRR